MSIPEYPKRQKKHVMQTSSRQTFYSSFHNYGNGKWFHLKGNYWGNPCFTEPSWKKMNHPPTINFQGISHFSGRVTHYTNEGIYRHSLLQMWSWWWLASCMGDTWMIRQVYTKCITPPKFNSSPLKDDGWKTTSYWVPVTFQGGSC